MASGSRYPRLLCPIGNQNRGGAADLRGKTMKVIWNMLNLCCPLENQPWGTRSSPGVSGKDVTEVAQKEESAGLTWTLQPSQSPQPHGPSQVCCQETSRVAKKQGQTPPPALSLHVSQTALLFFPFNCLNNRLRASYLPSFLPPNSQKN